VIVNSSSQNEDVCNFYARFKNIHSSRQLIQGALMLLISMNELCLVLNLFSVEYKSTAKD
jgi:hypothetical protein